VLRHILQITGAISLLMPITANAETPDPAMGLWLTQNERSVIEVKPCTDAKDGTICGNIYWIIEGGMQTDANNPDESLKNRAMCGLPILWGFDKQHAGAWDGGNIYKADDGDLYSANLETQDDGTLKVRGYLGVSWLGKTQIWTRADAAKYQKCR